MFFNCRVPFYTVSRKKNLQSSVNNFDNCLSRNILHKCVASYFLAVADSQIFYQMPSTVKPIIFKHVNMTSDWRHRYQWLFNFLRQLNT